MFIKKTLFIDLGENKKKPSSTGHNYVPVIRHGSSILTGVAKGWAFQLGPNIADSARAQVKVGHVD